MTVQGLQGRFLQACSTHLTTTSGQSAHWCLLIIMIARAVLPAAADFLLHLIVKICRGQEHAADISG
jgi:hypothetical protein